MTEPAYADVTGSIGLPASASNTATTITVKVGESNYDSFPATSKSGVALVYLETSLSSMTVSAGGSSSVPFVMTSASCFTSAHTYSLDYDSSGLTLSTVAGTASNDGATQTFAVPFMGGYPSSTVQFEIFPSS